MQDVSPDLTKAMVVSYRDMAWHRAAAFERAHRWAAAEVVHYLGAFVIRVYQAGDAIGYVRAGAV